MRRLRATVRTTGDLRPYVALVAAMMLAVGVLALLAPTKPAAAAFPGKNGDIAFENNYCHPTGRCSLLITRMNPDGSHPRHLLPEGQKSDWSEEPDWSANGRKIAFGHADEMYTMNADGTGRRRLTDSWRAEREPAWFPSGRKLAFYQYGQNAPGSDGYSQNIWVLALDEQGRPARSPTQLTGHPNDEVQPAISPGGKWMAFASNRSDPLAGGERSEFDIFVMQANSPEGPDNRPVNLTEGFSGSNYAPDWAPGGKQILFMRHFRRDGKNLLGIYKMNTDGSRKRELVVFSYDLFPGEQPPGGSPHAVWSPDSESIAFEKDEEIWRMRADGGRKVRLTSTGWPSLSSSNPDWQPLP